MENEQMKLDDYQFKEVNVRLCLKEASVYYSDTPITSPERAIDTMKDLLIDLDREVVCIVNLDNRKRTVNYNVIAMGGIDHCYFAVREIFKSSILSNATSVLMFHNHPSGDPAPSLADISITRRIIEAGELLGIPVDDHIIVGNITGDTFSFREAGMLSIDSIDSKVAEENTTKRNNQRR